MRSSRRSQAPTQRRDLNAFARLEPSRRVLAFAVSAAFTASAAPAFANPSGGSVAAGSASFVVNGKTLTITNTPGAVINWQQFSIQKDEITRFIQQNAASSVLNRVTSQNPSLILGQLHSNGRVFLINPSGIAFGQGAVIDVAGFAASTLNISDKDFISGRMRFQGSGAEGKLSNAGTIRTAEGGHVYLIAPNVENEKSGVITSPKGEVVIAAGRTVELVNSRTPELRVEFAAPDNQSVNAGEIVAAAGSVGIYGTLVRSSGRVSAGRAEMGPGGRIIFKATDTALVSGTVEAKAEAGKGGEIQILGRFVGLVDNALVDASGELGGGTVLIGGDFQGKNADVQNAEKTYVGRDAVIRADAVTNGDGGKVIVWSDDTTRFYGSLSARGGASGGNGGFAEISGKVNLDASIARVGLGAPKGRAGTLLLDPQDIVINGGSNDGSDTEAGDSATLLQQAAGTPGEILFADTPAGTFNIYESEIENTDANIRLQATRSIVTNGAFTNNDIKLMVDRNLTLEVDGSTGSGVINLKSADGTTSNFDNNNLIRTQGTGTVTIQGAANTNNIVVGDVQTDGGSVTIKSAGSGGGLLVGNITTAGSNTTNTSGGSVSLQMTGFGGFLGTGNIDTHGGGGALETAGGAGGAVTIVLASSGMTVGNVNTSGGSAGNVSTGGAPVAGGDAGSFQVTAATGLSDPMRVGTVTATGGDGSTATTLDGAGGAGGAGGLVRIQLTSMSIISQAVTTSGGAGGNSLGAHAAGTGGNAGRVNLEGGVNPFGVQTSGQALTATGGAGGSASGVGATAGSGGVGGDITVLSVSTATLADISTAGGAAGAASGSADAGADGVAAIVRVNAASQIALNGNVSAPNRLVNLTGNGITLASGRTVSSGTGIISADAGSGVLTLSSGSQLLSTGTIGLTANSMAFDTSGSPAQIGGSATGTGSATLVTLTQGTGGRAINLGSESPGQLSLFDAELDLVRASALRIGDAFSGAVTISANIDPANVGTTRITSGAGISSGANTITGTSLALVAGGAINVKTAASALAASTSAGGITISNSAAGGLTVGDVDSTAGISSSGSAISLTETAGDVTLARAVNAGAGTASITLDGANRLLTSSAAITGTAAGGVTLTADRMDLAGGTVNAGTGTGRVTLAAKDATRDIEVGAADTSTTLGLSTAEMQTITAGGGLTIGGGAQSGDVAANTALIATDLTGIGTALTLQSGTGTVAVNQSITTSGLGVSLVSGTSVALNANLTTAGGAVTVTGPTTLGTNLVVSAGAGAVAFGGTVNADLAANNRTLTVNSQSATTFGAAVGSTEALGGVSTDVGGTTTIRNVSTQGDVSFGDNVVLAATNTTVAAGTGSVLFKGTVNATASGGQSLTVNSSGTTTFEDAVGMVELASLTTNGGSVVLRSVNTTGDQTYNGDATLNGNYNILGNGSFSVDGATTLAGTANVFTAGTGNVNFTGRVDSDSSPWSLGVGSAGTVTFGSAVGGLAALSSLSVTSESFAADDITTAGGSVHLTIGSGTTSTGSITTTGRNGVPNSSTVSANAGAGGVVVISGGGTITVGAINTSGGTAGTPATGNVGGAGGNAGNVQITGTGGAVSTQSITANGGTGGDGGGVGDNGGKGGNAGAITITANGATNSVTTGNLLAQGGSGGASTGGISGDGGDGKAISVTSALSTVTVGAISNLGGAPGSGTGGVAGAGATITVSAAGLLELNGNISALNQLVTLSGSGVTLASSRTVNSGTGAINANAGTGVLTLNSGSQLLSTGAINLTADAMAFDASAQIGGSSTGAGFATVVTLKQSTIGRAIDLGTETGGQLSLFASELDLVRASTLRIGGATGGAITVSDNINTANVGTMKLTSGAGISSGSFTIAVGELALVAGGAISVNTAASTLAASTSTGAITISNTALDGLTVDSVDSVPGMSGTSAGITLTETAGDLTIGAAGITTSGGPILLTTQKVDGRLTLTGNVASNSGAAAGAAIAYTADQMAFVGTTNAGTGGPVTLRANDAAQTIAIGGTALDSATTLGLSGVELQKITAGGGLTIGSNAQAANLTVTGAITATDLAGIGPTLTLRTGTGTIAVNQSITTAGRDLALTGGAVALSNDLTTAGGAVTVTGPTTLGADVAVSAGAGAVKFDGTVNGAHDLAVTSSGATTFTGDVGTGGAALASLAVTSASTISVQAVTSSGGQSYTATTSTTLNGNLSTDGGNVGFTGPVLLGSDVTIDANGTTVGNVTFSATSTVNGARNLAVDGGVVTLNADVGTQGELTSLTVDGTVSLRSVSTTGDQTYNGDATLNGNYNIFGNGSFSVDGATTLAGTANVFTAGTGNVNFGDTVDSGSFGPWSLGVGSGGTVTFGSAVGGLAALSSLFVTSESLAAGDITTAGGSVHLMIGSGTTSTGSITTTGRNGLGGSGTPSANAGAGGQVTISGGGTITVGAINTSGGTGATPTAGNTGGAGGNAGNVQITGTGGAVSTQSITANGGTGGDGGGAGDSGGKGGNAGTITITGTGGTSSVTTNGQALLAQGGKGGAADGSAATTGAGGDSKAITVTSGAGITVAAISNVGAGPGDATNGAALGAPGTGASVTLSGAGNVTISNAIAASGALNILFGQGGGSTLDLSASGALSGTSVSLTGGAGSDTLIGLNAVNTWNVMGADEGTLNGVFFSAVENLTGGTDDDTFNLNGPGSVSGTIAGGGGTTNTLSYAGRSSTVTVTLAGTGEGSGTDVFAFNGLNTVTGSTATDNTLTGPDAVNTWTVNGLDSGSVSGLNFSAFANLTGGALQDAFVLTGAGAVSGVISGGAGTQNHNTLVGADVANTWNITAENDGNVVGANAVNAFTAIGNLQGGSDADSFVFASAGNLTGTVDGAAGADTLNWSAKAAAHNVVLTALGAIDGFDGTQGTIAGGFQNIDSITGSTTAGGKLTGIDAAATWSVAGANSGSYLSTRSLGFSSMSSLTGGTDNDTFNLGASGSVGGTIDGGGGTTNTLSYASRSTTVDVTLSGTGAGSGTNVFAFTGLSAVTGSSATDNTLTGPNAASTWTVNAADGGSVAGVAFSAFANLAGGSDDDTFALQTGGSVSGTVTGGAGTNTLDYAAYGGTVALNLADSSATGIKSAGANGFSNVQSLVGNDGTSGTNTTLTGFAAGSTYNLTGANSGDVGGTFTYSGVGNLTDSGAGVFNMHAGADGSVSGNLTAAAGTVDYTGYTSAPSFDLGGGAGTGMGGWTGITTVTGRAASDGTIAGSADTYNLTGSDAGDNGAVSWTKMGNLADAGGGTFIVTTGSLSGTVDGGTGSTLDYSGFSGTVAVNATGTATNLGGFSGIASLLGNGADTTLTGSGTFTVDGVDSGNLNTTFAFSSVANLSGEGGDDSFKLDNSGGTASLSGSINGAGGTNTLDYAAYTGTVAVSLADSSATAIKGAAASGFSNIQALVGNDGTAGTNTTLTGSNTSTTYDVTATNTGTAGGVSFSGVGNLTGGTGNDSFVIQNAGSLTGSIVGGGQALADTLDLSNKTGTVTFNLQTSSATGLGGTFSGIEALTGNDGTTGTNTTLTGANAGATFNVAGINSGTVAGVSFSGVGNLTGGTGNDSFVIQDAGSLTGGIVGGSQILADTLDLSNKSGLVAINLQTGAATGIGGTFSGIEALTGNDGTTGTNTTLTGTNAGATFNVAGVNSGTAAGVSFSGAGNLAGGSGNDSFVIQDAGSLTGSIAGGSQALADTLDLSNKTGTVAINLQTNTATGIGSFSGIEALVGNDGTTGTNTTLTGVNAGTTFNVTAANAGTASGVSFSGVGNLTGGTGDDSFVIQNAGLLTGNIVGGSQVLADTLDLSNKTGAVAFNLQSNSATGIGAFSGIEALVGNDGATGANTTLTGLNAGTTFNVTAANTGTASGVSFSGVGNLTGGSGNDSFVIQDAGSLAGSVVGGSQALADTLDLSNKTGLVAINLETGAATGLGGTFSGIEALVGNDGTAGTSTTLTGVNAGTTFNVTAANAGTASGVSFSGVGNLTGGSGNDSFVIQDAGSLAGSVVGGSQALADTLDLSNKTGLVAINLETGAATGLGGTFSGIEALVGNDGTAGTSTTLTGVNAGTTFNVTAANAGTASGVSFSGVGNLTGGSGNDSFVIQDAGSLAGSVVGGSQAVADTLDLSNKTGAVAFNLQTGTATGVGTYTGIEALVGNDGTTGTNTTLTGLNAGTTFNVTAANTGTASGVSFSGVGNLTGGSGNDSFVIQNAGSLTGSVVGGSQALADTLDLSNKTGPVAFNLQTSSVTGLGGAFSGIEALVGNDGTTGTNTTLTGLNAGTTFNVMAANTGTASGVSFSGVGNLTGGSGNDSFVIQNAGSLTGSVVGGSQALADTLDLSNKTGPVALNLQTSSATGLGGTFSGIEALVGNDGTTGSNTTLTGLNAGTTFNVATVNAGTAAGVSFSGVGNLTGGSGNDSFVIQNAGSLTGSVAGGSQALADTLDLSNKTGLVAINLETGAATGLGGTFSGIEALVGNDGTTGTNTTLTGVNAGTIFNVTAVNAGTAGGVSFSGVGNLSGGSGNDSFVIQNAASLAGSVAGGSQALADTLDLSNKTGTVAINLQTGAATGLGGAFSGIETLVGNDGTTGTTTTLTGANAGTTYNINTANAGTAGGVSFSGVGNLTGGTGDDGFVFANAGSLSGNVAGGGHTTRDAIDLSAKAGAVAINLQAATATGIGGTWSGINDFVGNDGTTGTNTTLTGSNTGTTYNITAVNAGTAGGVSFSGVGNLNGGTGADTFNGTGGRFTGSLDDGNGASTLTGTIQTGGTQAYHGAVTLGADTTLIGSAITFNGTVAGSAHSLALTGNAVFGDAPADTVTGLTTLSVSGTSAINTSAISSSGAQTYSGAVTLGANTTLSGSTVTFNDTVTGAAHSLAVTGNAVFGDAPVDTVTGLTTLSVSGTSAINTSAISSSGAQTYSGAVTLGANTTLSGSTVTFNDTVAGAAHSLAVTGNAVFGDASVDTVAGLTTLSVSGTSAINTSAITSSGTQTYDGAVTLGANTTLSGSTVTFNDTVAGAAHSLAVTGNAVFGDATVDAVAGLTTLSVSGTSAINTSAITSSGTQTYSGAVTLGADTTLTGSTVTFNDTVAGAAHSLAVTGNAVFGNAPADTVAGLITLSVSGTSAINMSAITSSGTQTYSGAVTLGTDTTLTGSTVIFNDTVAGAAHSLAVTGNAVFGNAPVDTVAGLTTLSVSGTSAINTSAITSSGAQTYGDTVALGTGTTLTGTTVTFNGAAALAGNQALAVAGDAVFNGTVDIGSLSVSGTSAINTAAITTAGAQTYAGLASLGSDTTLTGTTPTFTTGIDGNAFDLTLSFSGTTQINGASFADINNLTSDNNGVTRLTGTILTTGTQTYLDDVILAGSTSASAAGNLVRFGGTLNALTPGSQSLTVPGSGGVRFDGAVGGSAALASLSVTGPAAINGGSIATTTDQTFSAAVVLGANTALSGNDISFASTVNSDAAPRSLTVDTSGSGVTTFGDSVGGISALAGLSTNADGATNIASGRTIRTTGAQAFADAVTANALTLDAGGAITATNVLNDFTGTLELAGGVVQITDRNSLALGAGTITGSATVIALDGSITTGGSAFSAAGGITFRAHDGGGTPKANIGVGAGGLSASGPISLHAADDVIINGTVTSGGNRIELIAGVSAGLKTTGSDSVALAATESTADNLAAVTINQMVNAGAGQIVIVTAAGGAADTAHNSDVTQGVNGALVSNALGVATLKGAVSGDVGGDILLHTATTPQNTNPNVQFLTCLSDGCPSPLPGNPVMPVNSGTGYSFGQIRYVGAGGVNLTGIGTVGDFISSTVGSFTLTANPFSAGNVTIQATEDIVIDLANVLERISDLPASTLNFDAGRSIYYVNPGYSGKGKTIGDPTDATKRFKNHLKFTAGESIVLNNAIYQDTGNLDLLAGTGNVTLLGSFPVYTGGNVRATGVDFSLLGYGNVRPPGGPGSPVVNADPAQALGSSAPDGTSARGQELIAAGTVTLENSGVITIRAGTATATSGNGARLQGGTVNIGSASTPADNPTLLIVEGGSNDVGVASSSTSNPAIEFNQANAVVRANGAMNIYLRKELGPSGLAGLPALGEDYSLVVRGGYVDAQNGGTLPLFVTALGALQASTLTLQTEGAILFQGGTTDLRTANTFAASSALLLVQNEKTISAGGSVVLIGGNVNVNANDAVTLQPLTSTSAGNAVSIAQLDPSKLTMTVNGILVLQGGQTTGPQGALASARIDAGDEIRITVNGSKSYTYTPSSGPDKTLGPGSFFMIGGADSGFFDTNNIDLAGSLLYPQAFPVTVTLAGNFIREVDLGLASGVVQTGLATFDDSLLSYIIFAANEETRALRIRRGFGDGEDVGAPACR